MNLGLETGQEAPALIAAVKDPAQSARLWSVRTLPKGAACFAPGDGSSDVFLMLSGLVKLVYTTEAGEDWIKSFILDLGVFSGRGASDAHQAKATVRSASNRAASSACRDHSSSVW